MIAAVYEVGFRLKLAVFCTAISMMHCVPTDPWEVIQRDCNSLPKANITIGELKEIFPDGFHFIAEDYYLEGYVASSDKSGNFFNSIVIQDKRRSPQYGLEIRVDLLNSYSRYPLGSKIVIALQGLFIRVSKGMYSLGSARTLFGNRILAAIPANTGSVIMETSCEPVEGMDPLALNLEGLDDAHLQQLIALDGVQFAKGLPGLVLAVSGESTSREIVDCTKAKVFLRTSGFADFADSLIPHGNGSIRGILVKRANKYELVIREFGDIIMADPRCAE